MSFIDIRRTCRVVFGLFSCVRLARDVPRIALFVAVCTFAGGLSSIAKAEDVYPTRTVRILVGFPPGSGPDGSLRVFASKLSDAWGKPIIVENVSGAAGSIACEHAAKSAPDGYTLVLCSNAPLTVFPSLYTRQNFDPIADLLPITIVSSADNILVVPSSLSVRSVDDLVAMARAHPGKILYAHGGVGSTQHLAGALLKSMAKIDISPVGYRGATAVLPDLLSDRVQMFFGNIANTLPLVKDGKLRGLATTGKKRSFATPDIPTMEESGFRGFNCVPWYGLMAPAGTPPEIINKIYASSRQILAQSETRVQFHSLGFEVIGDSPAEFSEIIREETKYWADFIAKVGIKASD